MESTAFNGEEADLTFLEVYDELPQGFKRAIQVVVDFTKLGGLVLAVLCCAAAYSLLLGWICIFWLQTQLFLKTSTLLRICYDVPRSFDSRNGNDGDDSMHSRRKPDDPSTVSLDMGREKRIPSAPSRSHTAEDLDMFEEFLNSPKTSREPSASHQASQAPEYENVYTQGVANCFEASLNGKADQVLERIKKQEEEMELQIAKAQQQANGENGEGDDVATQQTDHDGSAAHVMSQHTHGFSKDSRTSLNEPAKHLSNASVRPAKVSTKLAREEDKAQKKAAAQTDWVRSLQSAPGKRQSLRSRLPLPSKAGAPSPGHNTFPMMHSKNTVQSFRRTQFNNEHNKARDVEKKTSTENVLPPHLRAKMAAQAAKQDSQPPRPDPGDEMEHVSSKSAVKDGLPASTMAKAKVQSENCLPPQDSVAERDIPEPTPILISTLAEPTTIDRLKLFNTSPNRRGVVGDSNNSGQTGASREVQCTRCNRWMFARDHGATEQAICLPCETVASRIDNAQGVVAGLWRVKSTSALPKPSHAESGDIIKQAVDVLNQQAQQKRENMSPQKAFTDADKGETNAAVPEPAPNTRVFSLTGYQHPDLLDLSFDDDEVCSRASSAVASSKRASSLSGAALPFFAPSSSGSHGKKAGSERTLSGAALPFFAPATNALNKNNVKVKDDGRGRDCHPESDVPAYLHDLSQLSQTDSSYHFYNNQHSEVHGGGMNNVEEQHLGPQVRDHVQSQVHVSDAFPLSFNAQPSENEALKRTGNRGADLHPLGHSVPEYSAECSGRIDAESPRQKEHTPSYEGAAAENSDSPSTAENASSTHLDTDLQPSLKKRKRAARAELKQAWVDREQIRTRLTGTYTLDGARALEDATTAYNSERRNLMECMASGELPEQDAKEFPYLSNADLSVPKVRPTGLAPKEPTKAKAIAVTTVRSPTPVDKENKAADLEALHAKVLKARELYEEAYAYFDRPPPPGRSNLSVLKAQGEQRIDRAIKFYKEKREELRAAYHPQGVPEWLENQLWEYDDKAEKKRRAAKLRY